MIALAAAVDSHQLSGPFRRRPLWLRPPGAPPDTPAVLEHDEHGCVFYEARDGGRCRIQRALGPAALPMACRQFPRVSVIDPRGASVTLSHYCPTAASLLDDGTTIAIVEDPPAFPRDSEIVGLEVPDDRPPLLTPEMFMDWESWWEWERRAIETIARADSAAHAIACLSAAVETVRDWTPQRGPLRNAVIDAFARGSRGSVTPPYETARSDVLSAVPADVRPAALEGAARPSSTVLRAFVAAHAFANWTAHLGQGLRTWLRSVEAAAALATDLGVRQADLLLRHLADPHALARVWSEAERPRRSSSYFNTSGAGSVSTSGSN